MPHIFSATAILCVAIFSPTITGQAASRAPYPSLHVLERVLLTTAKDDFSGDAQAFAAAATWDRQRLRASSNTDSSNGRNDVVTAPHLACALYDYGSSTFSRLKELLSPEAVRLVSHSKRDGTCFFVSASDTEADVMSSAPDHFGLEGFAPFPSAMKLAPGLLEHQKRLHSGGLSASHGSSMRKGRVDGLTIELSPGALPVHSRQADNFVGELLEDLMSESTDLRSTNFWSDPATAEGPHITNPGGYVRRHDWTMAAAVVHELSKAGKTSPGDICSWNSVAVSHVADNVLLISGLDHLLYSGRGAGGNEEEANELHVACFMGLVSILASRHQTLRVAPTYSRRLLDAAARAIIQTATLTDTPLTAAGLDGTGEIIQVVDSGLDETSCFFIDGDGREVTHGYYFDGLGYSNESSSDSSYSSYYPYSYYSYSNSSSPFYSYSYSPSSYSYYSYYHQVFQGGDFTAYPSRRKIIQYIDMIKPNATSELLGSSSSISWIPDDGFGDDEKAGHGTHTAGTAAGSTLNTSAETVTCGSGETLSCVGACIDATGSDDDLVSSYYQDADVDRLCPMLGCDDSEACLGDDVGATLTANGGMAQGAKISIFDVFSGDSALMDFAGNGLWEPCLEAGCKIHSNSWGSFGTCDLTTSDILYDNFMYMNTENLLIFAAGNDGENPFNTSCTIGSPAMAKNALAVGATSTGETRLNTDEVYDIEHVASFSSWGFTPDGRVKPEVVAPGDMIYSAAGDGSDTHSCRLWAYAGTSMATPLVAGASAMVRQYFANESFYVDDVKTRDLCDNGFLCESFSPSSATVKAMLINSANLMGGGSEPDGYRGFGRIHLESGLPLRGEGKLAVFVADANYTAISEYYQRDYLFDVDSDANISFRATLSWIDPPATLFSAVQLVHDLDLAVESPSGTMYRMWTSGEKDAANVNERVVVDASNVESGTWTVSVSSSSLSTTSQSYSLVVHGAINSVTEEERSFEPSSGSASVLPNSIEWSWIMLVAAGSFAAAAF